MVADERWQILLDKHWTFAVAVVKQNQDCRGYNLLQSLSVRLELSAKRQQC